MTNEEYTGVIEITSVKNIITNDDTITSLPTSKQLGSNDVRFVHYPDCQQLIIWLPQNGHAYGLLRLWNNTDNVLKEETLTSKRLNGSIQILWDTLYLAPGLYTIEINGDNFQHIISFTKHQPENKPVVKELPKVIPYQQTEAKRPIEYTDGFGNKIKNEDLIIATRLKEK